MIGLGALRLRTSVVLLLVGTFLLTLLVVGSAIIAAMSKNIGDESQADVVFAATEISTRIERHLDEIEARVRLVTQIPTVSAVDDLKLALENARGPSLAAVYVIDGEGKLVAASIRDLSDERLDELTGIDLSTYLANSLSLGEGKIRWSDKHISAVTGTVTVGLAIPLDGAGAVIAELPLEELIAISNLTGQRGSLDYWIVDRKGEVVADTDPTQFEQINLSTLPIIKAAFTGQALPETMTLAGKKFHVSAAYSDTVGWLFVSRIPAGLQNPRLRQVVIVVVLLLVGSVLTGLLLSPFWSMRIVRPLREVAYSAHRIASGDIPRTWPRSDIIELNILSDDLSAMAEAIARREDDLRKLNEDLEERVLERTAEFKRANTELQSALDTLNQAKDELIRSEKLAALGRLVAGVAHELNTPLGNSQMAVSTLGDRLRVFKESLGDGLRRSELERFIGAVQTAVDISEQNLRRAVTLMGSFKEVAADRTASRRRKFDLKEIVDEVVLTVSPSIKRKPVELKVDVPDDLLMESFPGELGQVLTNLIDNAVRHGLAGRDKGTIEIKVTDHTGEFVTICVEDDGKGMPVFVRRRAFDPFYTTTLGQGGTGLGLFISHNAATNVLGGTIDMHSVPGEGTRFFIRIPRVAPVGRPGDENLEHP